MIHIVLTRRYAYTVSTYLASTIGAHAGPVQALLYQDLFRRSELARGTYVFTDFDRLSESLRGQVEKIAGVLDSHGVRRLNRPAGWLSRRELLERLHAEGINPFRAFRLDDVPGDVRYPVFLRLENDHRGVRSGLLNDRAFRSDRVPSAAQPRVPHGPGSRRTTHAFLRNTELAGLAPSS